MFAIGIIAIIVILVLVLIIWAVGVNNHAKQLRIGIDEARADVEVYLIKRYDVLTESCKTVKSFAGHEKEMFADLVKLRKGMSTAELSQAASAQNKLATQLFAVGEAYPELKSAEVYAKLQSQISDENEHYAAAKRAFNSNVSIYNKYIIKFPASIVAGMVGCYREEFIKDMDAESKRDATLDL